MSESLQLYPSNLINVCLLRLWKSEKHQRVPPLKRKKIFVSDFIQIVCVQPLDHKDFKFWVTLKHWFSISLRRMDFLVHIHFCTFEYWFQSNYKNLHHSHPYSPFFCHIFCQSRYKIHVNMWILSQGCTEMDFLINYAYYSLSNCEIFESLTLVKTKSTLYVSQSCADGS